MKSLTRNQQGFGHVAVLLVILFVAVAGFAGYKVVSMARSDNGSVASTGAATNVKVPAVITSKADLTAASKALDSQTSQINSSFDANALNGDLNDML